MRKFLLVAVVALLAWLPMSASAQMSAPSGETVNIHKVLAIGAGVLIGAAVVDAVVVGDVFVLAGGIAGGFIGAWWYNNADSDGLPRMAIREQTATVMPASYRIIDAGGSN